jgi:hypothetical protein
MDYVVDDLGAPMHPTIRARRATVYAMLNVSILAAKLRAGGNVVTVSEWTTDMPLHDIGGF